MRLTPWPYVVLEWKNPNQFSRRRDFDSIPPSEPDIEANRSSAPPDWPKAKDFSARKHSKPADCSCCVNGCFDAPIEKLDIKVGKGKKAKRFIVQKKLICHHSEFFRAGCRSNFAESISNRFDLLEDDPEVFEQFVEWMYDLSPDRMPPMYDCSLSTLSYVPRMKNPERNWILADKLVAIQYSKFALAHFIQGVQITPASVFVQIVQETMPRSALHLFVLEWVAFSRFHRFHAGRSLEGLSEFGLITDMDPRQASLDHWYDECARNSQKTCHHQYYHRVLKTADIKREEVIISDRKVAKVLHCITVIITVILLTLSITITLSTTYAKIRQTTKNYSLFVSATGALTTLYPLLGFGSGFFALCDGIATAADSNKCWKSNHAAGIPDVGVCKQITALTVFLWIGGFWYLAMAPATYCIWRG